MNRANKTKKQKNETSQRGGWNRGTWLWCVGSFSATMCGTTPEWSGGSRWQNTARNNARWTTLTTLARGLAPPQRMERLERVERWSKKFVPDTGRTQRHCGGRGGGGGTFGLRDEGARFESGTTDGPSDGGLPLGVHFSTTTTKCRTRKKGQKSGGTRNAPGTHGQHNIAHK